MDPGADAGFGGMGGPDGISGSGDFGGGFGGSGYGGSDYGGGYNAPSIARGLESIGSQSALDAAISSGALAPGGVSPSSSLNTKAKTFRGLVMGFFGVLTTFATGSIPAGLAVATLIGKFGLTPERAQAMVESVQNGQFSPEQAAQRGASEAVFGNPDGGPADQIQQQKDGQKNMTGAGSQKETDPASASFWEQFVDEWQTAKENIRINDEFKKTVLSPAFDTYQQRLSGLSQEATFKPINVKMGDFQTSFVPKRAVSNAGEILSSQIAEADVMQPKAAEMSYLDRLQGIATTEQGWQTQKDIAKITGKQPNDKGTTTDAITDWLGIVKGGSDLLDSWF